MKIELGKKGLYCCKVLVFGGKLVNFCEVLVEVEMIFYMYGGIW